MTSVRPFILALYFTGTVMSCFSTVSGSNEVFFSLGMFRLHEPNPATKQIMEIHFK